MIYLIAEPAPGGRGLVGIYPSWQDQDHAGEARLLEQIRDRYCTIIFTRNYFSQFFERISLALDAYGSMIDIVAGWDVEKIRTFFLPLNPHVEVFRISAMHFNHFTLLDEVRAAQHKSAAKEFDLFFTAVERPDRLKNMELLAKLLVSVPWPLSVVGYGTGSERIWGALAGNPHLTITFRKKAKVDDPMQRRAFLRDLARSRALLTTSRYEGYSRLIGEALYLQVPVLLNAGIQCENWLHLNQHNCRTFIESTFEACLKEIISRDWQFKPPDYEDGNKLLKNCFDTYLVARGLPPGRVWHTLRFGGFGDQVITSESIPCLP